MLSRQFVRNAQLHVLIMRYFTRSSIIREINKADKVSAQKGNETVNKSDNLGYVSHMYHVTDFDKRILVWVKRYPSIADVPESVTMDCILTARSKARIKTCNYMIVFTLIGCLGAVILGKRQAARGESLSKQREVWLQEKIAEDKNK